MSFYLKPPRGVINNHKLEECIQQRLLSYDQLNSNANLEITNFDCMVEDGALDRTGHYMFRLAAFANPSFASTFLKSEYKLLEARFNIYSNSDAKYFFKKLLNHCRECLNLGHFSKDLHHFYVTLNESCTQMLKYFKLRLSKEIFVEVPFYHCASLVSTRKVFLSKGFALISCSQWKDLFTSLFETHLLQVLKEMQFSQSVQNTLLDDRIQSSLKLITNVYGESSPDGQSTFNLSSIERESKLFPLCMQNLYAILRKTNRLSHNARYDFSLYLKGIGVSLGDSVQFWETAYSKEHASCARCTHNWQTNAKRYIYGIRHLYGLEGSRKNYPARSCSYLQGVTLGASEEGGCPFRQFDEENLRSTLKDILPNGDDEIEVMIHERQQNPTKSCKLLYENVAKALNRKLLNKNINFNDPVQYYENLRADIDATSYS